MVDENWPGMLESHGVFGIGTILEALLSEPPTL
jgi:hypothetical protein